MATLPLSFECSFDSNSIASFDSETDTNSKLSIQHYSALARLSPSCEPYKGAYAGFCDLSLGTADAYWQSDTALDTALAGTVALRFYFYATALTMATSDRFTLAALQSGAGTDEATISVYNNAGTIQLVAAETGATAIGAATRATDLIQSQWHCLELVCTIDDGGSNNGTIKFYVDGYQVGATISSLDQAAITQMRLGTIGIDAGTTAGRLLFDQIGGDDLRVGPLTNRFGQSRILTQTGHAVLGQASLMEADLLLSSTGDETCLFYDSDTADSLDISKRIVVFGQHNPIHITRGLYAVLAGTNPVLSVKVWSANDMSSDQIKALGVAR